MIDVFDGVVVLRNEKIKKDSQFKVGEWAAFLRPFCFSDLTAKARRRKGGSNVVVTHVTNAAPVDPRCKRGPVWR
jgi:hypothetical protein